MKARDIKKQLLEDYNCATIHYCKVVAQQEERLKIDQCRIRTLEGQLSNLFGVEKEFDFNAKIVREGK